MVARPTWIPTPARIGLDLGTKRTRLWIAGKGLVLDEPTALALDTATRKITAVGKDAADMWGRVQSSMEIIFPVVNGSIEDKEIVAAYLKILLQRVISSSYFFRPSMMVSVSPRVVDTDKQALVEVLYEVGASEVYTIAQSLAGAIGAGVPIADASGTGIFHLGEGIAEASVVSLSSVVANKTSYVAGQYLRDHLRYVLGQVTQVEISSESIETLFKTLSFDPQQAWKLEVTGKDKVTGRPAQVEITHQMIEEVLEQVLEHWLSMIEKIFQKIPPALTTDILDKGLLLSGGLSQLQGLELRLATALNVPVSTVEEPDHVVIQGVGTALDHLELFKESIGYSD